MICQSYMEIAPQLGEQNEHYEITPQLGEKVYQLVAKTASNILKVL